MRFFQKRGDTMAVKKKSKVGSSKSTKKSVKTTSVKAPAKPTPKKAAASKAAPSRSSSRVAAKKTVQKVPPAKPASDTKKKAVVKVVAKPTPKAARPAPPSKKLLVKKNVSKVPVTPAKPAPKQPAATADKKSRFHKTDLTHFKLDLIAMRDRITGQSGSMRSDALQRTDEVNTEEDGTDAFMRLQTLEQVSSQQQIVANINEALHAIEKGTYGVCDSCGELISKARLSVLPFAKNCIKCQSEMERNSRFSGRR